MPSLSSTSPRFSTSAFPSRGQITSEGCSGLPCACLQSPQPCHCPFLPRMTRHGKNCTAGAVYTYHEKKKDTGAGLGQGGAWMCLGVTISPRAGCLSPAPDTH